MLINFALNYKILTELEDYRKILTRYWGYSQFRPLQEEIIQSVADGKDTLALMPTGGGKSITYQVPFMEQEGLTLVITPLIALMNDQVNHLKQLKIKAVAIHSGLSSWELDVAFDNCVFGGVKFLYLSPERLGTPMFLARLKDLKVNLIAVDEAHCISQWGYDFRPSYLKIVEIRKLLPGVPVLALTATATKQTVKDIQEKLGFNKDNVIRQSFERKNLVYWVHQAEDKQTYLLRLLNQKPGSAIVYVRSRKKTKEIAEFLIRHHIEAAYYHAGLDNRERGIRQEGWQNNTIRVMVSTNAFGMGIDKPDVRLVVHWDLPDSPEAYFQEAGRGGRDGKKAFAVLLYHPSDKISLNQSFRVRFPEIETIQKVYQALGHYYQLIPGSGRGKVFEFDLRDFAQKFGYHSLVAFHAIKHLERAGYIELTEEIDLPSRLFFRVGRDDLYRFQVTNADYDGLIKLLLRLYSGLFSDFVPINEHFIATKAGTRKETIEKVLTNLHNMGIVYYLMPTKHPRMIFTAERLENKSLILPVEQFEWRKAESRNRLDFMIDYGEVADRCRSQRLLLYFGEKDPFTCKQCDVCRGKALIPKEKTDQIRDQIILQLKKSKLTPKELVLLVGEDESVIDLVLSEMIDSKKVLFHKGQLTLIL